MKSLLVLLAAVSLMALAAGAVSAYDWGPNGVPVAGPVSNQDAQRILPDGKGGAFIAWRDSRHGEDVYLQRITAAGQVAPGWPSDGFPVCTNPAQQELTDIASDGQGGVLLVWQDSRNVETLGTLNDVYAQRVLPNATLALGWPVDGAPVSRNLGYQSDPVIEADGAGGCYVAWSDWTDYGYVPKAFAQHLAADGQPAPGWPADGRQVSADRGGALAVIADGVDGAVVVWGQARGDSSDVYALKVTPSGEIAPGWPVGGAPIALGCGGRAAIPDGAGGFYVVCALIEGAFEKEYEVHRWTFGGTRVPGWPSAGLLVGVAPGVRPGPIVAEDGFGGALLAWYDYRNPLGGSDVYVTRVRPDATFAPGWPQDGVLVSDPTQDLETNVDVANDGAGGAYVVWQWDTYTGSPSKIQHVTGQGTIAPGWPSNGVVVSQQSDEFDPAIAPDGQGGAIVVWDNTNVFAQHFSMEPPVPTLPALTSAEVTPERVILRWLSSETSSPSGTVFRRTAETDWEAIGTPSTEASGVLLYEDRTVKAAERYAYRLGIREGDAEVFTAETWVEVPAGYSFALEGFRPNPAASPCQIAFSLADDSPATLEIYTIAGRRAMQESVGSLGPGSHVVDLSRGSNLAAGVYWIRLTQSMKSVTTKGIIVQ